MRATVSARRSCPAAHRSQRAPTFAWIVAGLVPAIVQLMYGVRDVGLVEEWGVLRRFDQIGPVFWTPLDHGGLDAQAIRPLTVAPHALAYLLDPDSFVWYHLLQSAALGLKGVAMLALLTRLGFRRTSCLVGALVFALFPAWDGLFSFRTIHAQFAMAFLVVAAVQLLAFHTHPNWRRGVLVGAALALSLLLYEVAYVAILFVPLLLLVRGRTSFRVLALSACVWFIVPLLNGLRVIWLLNSGETLYQETITQGSSRTPIPESLELGSRVLGNGFGWLFDPQWGFRVSAASVALLVVVGVAAWLCTSAGERDASPTERAISTRTLWGIVICGTLTAPIVALVYWPQPAHLVDPLRIFSIASLPLTLAIVAGLDLCAALKRTGETLLLLGACLLLATTLFAADAQRHAWHRRAVFQEHVLGAINSTSLDPESTTIVVVDPDLVLGGTDLASVYRLPVYILGSAESYLAHERKDLIMCRQRIETIRSFPTTSDGPQSCTRRGDVLRQGKRSVPLRDASIVEIRRARPGRSWSGDPRHLGSRRAAGILSCVASGTCDDAHDGIEARIVKLEPAT